MPRSAQHTPESYLESIVDDDRRAEMSKLHELIRRTVPSLAPFVERGMIGYGRYRYRYASGREGVTATIGLSSRAQYISLYVCAVKDGRHLAEQYKERLPKASIGKSCVRFRRLADLDLNALRSLLKEGARHPMGAVKEE